ncbi:bacterial proteasome activator family protein [Segeticoccus rhizosphaerae]|uniref:bacterial proteasome activator family protein n=1 Tax=Segeticoccus rhizosphaerae TaxID=1104777 RepID=UPI001264A23A|nr:bacterial proteasome activator family protein [Segeticoccus rhizosphaerae]
MTQSQQEPEKRPAHASDEPTGDDAQRVVIVTEGGMGVADSTSSDSDESRRGESDDDRGNPTDLVEQPAKVMRIGSMIKQLLDEVRNAPLDEAGRARLAEIHRRSIAELKDGLAPELTEELDRIALPFTEEAPSEPELRIAQAQLVGWLEGLFHGIQTAIMAQQMAAQAQLQGMRRALPPGHPAAQGQHMVPGQAPQGGPHAADGGPTGQYL